MFPETLNSLSEAQLVAQTESSFLANVANEGGNVLACSFHHFQGDMSLSTSRIGHERYDSISFVTFCSAERSVGLSSVFFRKVTSLFFLGGGGEWTVLDSTLSEVADPVLCEVSTSP